ncbi:MAG: tRNA 2-thiocytidine(32) synthetase TtcA [Clostridia bacterium]|nr:tRNA 2-thiocytidine(32) synthetase TtcA [Clostridia bacterium]
MDLRRVLSYVRRAVDDYNMIEDGDRIAVGISGGKDSLTLVAGLAAMRRFYPKRYEVMAITVDMGFEGGSDFSEIEAFCRELDVPYHVVKTDIYNIIFNIRKEKSPCALCSKMRRGVLHNTARDLGCNVVALGHHQDDVIDTFMLNLFYEGRIGCFEPVSYLSRAGVKVIRPLLYMPEKSVIYFTNKNQLPVYKSPCPADGYTQRAEVGNFLRTMEKHSPGLRYRIFGAIQRGNVDGFHPVNLEPHSSKRKKEAIQKSAEESAVSPVIEETKDE